MTDTKVIKEYAVSVAVYREDLIRLLSKLKKRGVNRYTSKYLEERLKLANDFHYNIRECHIKLVAAYEPQELAATPYAVNNVYESALEGFETVENYILDHLSRLEANSAPANTNSSANAECNASSSMRLPKIDLPRFSGDYAEWLTFHDTFKAMIHDNVGLPGIQKFHYLKSCLEGEARTVLQALTVSSDNYTVWNTLVSRYHNRRIITSTLLNRFTQLGSIGGNNLTSLKALRDTVAVTLDALRNLNYAVDSWDPLIVHLVASSFEPAFRLEWERTISDLADYPAYGKLTEFLSNKVSMLESLVLNRSSGVKVSERPIKSHTASVRNLKCVQCGQNHALTRCEQFLKLQPPTRLNVAHRKKICVNCLRKVVTSLRSESSFVTENLVQLLRVNRVPVSASISGVTGQVSLKVKGETVINLQSLKGSQAALTVSALIIPKITGYMPASFSPSNFPELKPEDLADRAEISSSPIDFLIGADYYPQLVTNRSLTSVDGALIAQSTIFGWVVSGVLSQQSRVPTTTVHHCCNVEQGLRRFWELEEVPESISCSDEDRFCEEFFQKTVEQDKDGRFVVALPFKPGFDSSNLGTSQHIAEASLRRVGKSFLNNPVRKEQYIQFMQEYESLGHMSPVSNDSLAAKNRIYLPHHAVVKSVSGKEKVRVVFNASSRTSTGIFLNDVLLVGPKLQKDITSILLNWRGHKVAGVADVVKMFRQILVRPHDRLLQSILWQTPLGEQVFELNTVTYGTGPAPFLAMRVLQELAVRFGSEFPHAQRVLFDSVYVDDLLFGADDIVTLELIQSQLVKLLSKGGFSLSKWATNAPRNPDVVSSPESRIVFSDSDPNQHKILSVAWDTVEDVFLFQISTEKFTTVTKRTLLSENSKIFDLMGWISSVTIVLKQLMQSTLLLKLSWDEEIPEPTRSKWLHAYSQLGELQRLSLPRWDNFRPGSRFELIGFCDASSLAYGAVVYSKVTTLDGIVTVNLIMAKAKVAPIKTVSIPRLELVAAALLTKLLSHVKASLARQLHAISCFTDSQITLAWIAQQPAKWKVFVANRVSYIQTELLEARWAHVKGTINPADLNSRGISPSELVNSRLWWNGPDFLRSEFITVHRELDTEEEKRTTALHVHKPEDNDLAFFGRFSSWPKAIRIIAYVRRFVARCRDPTVVHESLFSFQELQDAKLSIVRMVQAAEFQEDLRHLVRKENLPSRSRILSLDPFLGSDGLILVGGRLRNSSLSENEKHPLLLSPGPVADILIRNIHLRSLHGGCN